MSVKALESLLQMSVKGYNAVFIGSHLQDAVVRLKCATVRPTGNNNWRAGASQPSRTTGTNFLYIYISLCLSVRPV